jgi:hypothetical protein
MKYFLFRYMHMVCARKTQEQCERVLSSLYLNSNDNREDNVPLLFFGDKQLVKYVITFFVLELQDVSRSLV